MVSKYGRLIKYFSLLSACVLIFGAVAFYNAQSRGVFYPAFVDTDAKNYVETRLSPAQKNIYPDCVIEKYYVNGDKKVFKVVSSRGYADKVNIIILLNGTTVEKLVGVDNRETENYGAKCFNERFLNQFRGIDLSVITTLRGKNNNIQEGEIIYVSGATITSKAVIAAVNAVSAFLQA